MTAPMIWQSIRQPHDRAHQQRETLPRKRSIAQTPPSLYKEAQSKPRKYTISSDYQPTTRQPSTQQELIRAEPNTIAPAPLTAGNRINAPDTHRTRNRTRQTRHTIEQRSDSLDRHRPISRCPTSTFIKGNTCSLSTHSSHSIPEI